MTPTLKPGQILLAKNFELQKSSIGKIVYYEFMDKLMIKRLIGLPGDSIKIQDNKIMVNDKLTYTYPVSSTNVLQYYEEKIPEGHIYVIGDNPNNSLDSRKIGFIEVTMVKYQAIFRIWPPKLL